MASARLELRNIRRDGTGIIAVVFQAGHDIAGKLDRTRMYTKHRVSVKDWDARRQRIKSDPALTDQLQAFARRWERLYHELAKTGIVPRAEHVRMAIEAELAQPAQPAAPSFGTLDELWQRHMARMRKAGRSEGTIRNHQIALDHLNLYSPGAMPHHATFDWLAGFFRYLQSTQMEDVTAETYIKRTRAFLATVPGTGDWKDYTPPAPAPKVTISLWPDEVLALAQADTSDSPALQQVQASFLLQCAIGLRDADMRRLQDKQFAGPVLNTYTTKGNSRAIVPVPTWARLLVARYGAQRTMSQQEFNAALKDLGTLAKLTREVPVEKQIAGEYQLTFEPLRKHLSTHVARHTFATIVRSRMPHNMLTPALAHATARQSEAYGELLAGDAAQLADRLWEFMRPFLVRLQQGAKEGAKPGAKS